MTSRREFFHRAALAAAAVAVGTRVVGAQDPQVSPTATPDSSNLFSMDQQAAVPVRLPPKPGARPSMTAAQRDELEHRIRCQCGCTLDVFTCRTTDFSCQVSPAMHRDVIALVEGGYDAQEIVDQFVKAYGERALMAPKAEGFNLVGWTLPFVALLGGAIGVGVLIRRWGARAPTAAPASPTGPSATPDELARLDAAIRDDE